MNLTPRTGKTLSSLFLGNPRGDGKYFSLFEPMVSSALRQSIDWLCCFRVALAICPDDPQSQLVREFESMGQGQT